MHIGIDARLPAYRMGGISQYTIQLVRALAEIDKDDHFTVLHSRRDQRRHLPNGATNFERAVVWTPCHHRWERWALSAELLRYRLNVLHSPDFIPPQRGAKRHVITVHDLNFLHYPDLLTRESRRYYRQQIRWAVDHADMISADSHHTRNDLIETLAVDPERVVTIHLASNPLYQRPITADRVSAVLDDYHLKRGFILFVGTLEPRKNLPLLIDAYRELVAESGYDQPLVLVGKRGWLDDDIMDNLKGLQAEGQAIHLDGVSDGELAALYRGAGVLVLPSFYEGFGLPVLEAMHSGCPVVCSSRASLPEVCGDAAWQLEPEDSAAWTAAISEALFAGQARQSAIERGYQQAAKFNWRSTAEKTLELYRQAGE